ncbi:uncharacterized protein [Procambarus clarkii]|uniref:uncharacterized protein n=1 Tax=Procambarus clarkii TaxID=6728 RepID=UPI001E675ED3|nr:U-scoloptoxin(16)-Ssd1a-like [Procambarus clarkii]XP_045591558.1 U-scoloptoxin(16)-Ssd1a-like [Procambarus clarkii]
MAAKLMFLVVLLTPVGSSLAAVSLAEAELDPSNPDRCTYKGVGYSFKEEKSIPRRCEVGKCISSGGKTYVQFASCGVIGVQNGCRLSKEDLTKRYPACCPRQIC